MLPLLFFGAALTRSVRSRPRARSPRSHRSRKAWRDFQLPDGAETTIPRLVGHLFLDRSSTACRGGHPSFDFDLYVLRPSVLQLSQTPLRSSGSPQLSALALGNLPSEVKDEFSMHSFLASCTSLKRFHLYITSHGSIVPVLSLLKCELTMLDVATSEDSALGVDTKGSSDALGLLALAKLKRWSVERKCWVNEEERGRWEVACRARGINPRDDSNDASSPVSSTLSRVNKRS